MTFHIETNETAELRQQLEQLKKAAQPFVEAVREAELYEGQTIIDYPPESDWYHLLVTFDDTTEDSAGE